MCNQLKTMSLVTRSIIINNSVGGTGRDDISMQFDSRDFGHVGFIHGWLSSCARLETEKVEKDSIMFLKILEIGQLLFARL